MSFRIKSDWNPHSSCTRFFINHFFLKFIQLSTLKFQAISLLHHVLKVVGRDFRNPRSLSSRKDRYTPWERTKVFTYTLPRARPSHESVKSSLARAGMDGRTTYETRFIRSPRRHARPRDLWVCLTFSCFCNIEDRQPGETDSTDSSQWNYRFFEKCVPLLHTCLNFNGVAVLRALLTELALFSTDRRSNKFSWFFCLMWFCSEWSSGFFEKWFTRVWILKCRFSRLIKLDSVYCF